MTPAAPAGDPDLFASGGSIPVNVLLVRMRRATIKSGSTQLAPLTKSHEFVTLNPFGWAVHRAVCHKQ